jgi:hypothetical protein
MMEKKFSEAVSKALGADPGNTFALGCQKFLSERGYLSDKQLAALEAIKPTVYYTPDKPYNLLDETREDSISNYKGSNPKALGLLIQIANGSIRISEDMLAEHELEESLWQEHYNADGYDMYDLDWD